MNKNLAYSRETLMVRSRQYQLEYKKAQLAAEKKSTEEQIQAFEAKIKSQENSTPTDDIN